MQTHKCQILHEITETDRDIRVEVANTTRNAIDDDSDDDGDDECLTASDEHIPGKLQYDCSYKHAQLLLLGKGTTI